MKLFRSLTFKSIIIFIIVLFVLILIADILIDPQDFGNSFKEGFEAGYKAAKQLF